MEEKDAPYNLRAIVIYFQRSRLINMTWKFECICSSIAIVILRKKYVYYNVSFIISIPDMLIIM